MCVQQNFKNTYTKLRYILSYFLLRIKNAQQKNKTLFYPAYLFVNAHHIYIILPQQLIFFSKFKQRIILHSQTNLMQDVVYCLTFITLFCK